MAAPNPLQIGTQITLVQGSLSLVISNNTTGDGIFNGLGWEVALQDDLLGQVSSYSLEGSPILTGTRKLIYVAALSCTMPKRKLAILEGMFLEQQTSKTPVIVLDLRQPFQERGSTNTRAQASVGIDTSTVTGSAIYWPQWLFWMSKPQPRVAGNRGGCGTSIGEVQYSVEVGFSEVTKIPA